MSAYWILDIFYGASMILWLIGGIPTLLWGSKPARIVVIGLLLLLHIFVGGLAVVIGN